MSQKFAQKALIFTPSSMSGEHKEDVTDTDQTDHTPSHPTNQGSITWSQAEKLAFKTLGSRSAESVARVLTESGLSLR